MLNNDIMGNTRGIGGQASNTTMRVFSPGIPPEAPAAELRRFLYSGGELDVPARQLARYVDRTADRYVPELDVQVIYRLDRFGRGGDHTPFFLAGYPAVRLTEMYEDYTRQHQDLRTENGIVYGDVPDMVDYALHGQDHGAERGRAGVAGVWAARRAGLGDHPRRRLRQHHAALAGR